MAGKVNPVEILEFVANTQNGMKRIRERVTVDTNAVTFNAAMLMIGLDKEHAQSAHSPLRPGGPERGSCCTLDRLDAWRPKDRTPVEQLLFDNESRQTVPGVNGSIPARCFWKTACRLGPLATWPTSMASSSGSCTAPRRSSRTLRGAGVGRYGNIVLNPNLGLEPDTPVTLTIKALGSAPKPH